MLDHGFHARQITVQIAEGHLRLDHPELGGVTLGVGVLGAEGGAEGVNVTESHRKVLGIELAGYGQTGLLAEEVPGVVDGAVIVAGDVVKVQRSHLEHLACALAVAAGDDGGVDVDKAPLLEELMHGIGCHAAHTEGGAE